MQKLDDELKVSEEKNGELLYLWYQLTISSGYHSDSADGFKAEEDFVSKNGRMKFCVPVYKVLYGKDPAAAQRIYAAHQSFYHPIAQDAIESAMTPGQMKPINMPRGAWA